jgi:hypothetical protein
MAQITMNTVAAAIPATSCIQPVGTSMPASPKAISAASSSRNASPRLP